jgi:hypothetical protein
MAGKKDNENNPVVKTIGAVKIRKINTFSLRLNEFEFERLVRNSLISGLSVSKIIALSAQACPVCGNDHVNITIPLGLLSARKQATGSSVHKRPNQARYKSINNDDEG